uniref:Tetratricopeptide repeat protein 38 n=1 Tax=Setaria digitata TaxID=48799 RepID=A0A915PDM2_9BILA
MSTSSNEAARLFDALLRQYVSWSECEELGGMDNTLTRMIEAEPNASKIIHHFFLHSLLEPIMSRVLSLGLEAMGTGRSVRLDVDYQNELKQLLKDALKYGTTYEKSHAKAIHMFANDKMLAACEQWEKVLNETPNDLLALKFAHDAYFYLGNKHAIRDSIARVAFYLTLAQVTFHLTLPQVTFHLTLPQVAFHLTLPQVAFYLTLAQVTFHLTLAQVTFHLTLPQVTFHPALFATDDISSTLFYLHGMYAFGLEECEQYDEAEKHARKALELNRFDAWATHALAHCMEMNGHFKEGIHFMESTENDWNKCFLLACHNYWHVALYYIELQKYDEALSYYDKEIEERTKSGALLDIVDASSILLRLEMEGVSVGTRWKGLLPIVKPHMNDHLLAFNDVHIRMVIEGCNDQRARKDHSESVTNFMNRNSGDNSQVTQNIGKPICDAISDYYSGDYHKVVKTLAPIRYDFYRIGGSNAQRDIFTQILIHSALSSKEMDDHKLAK